MPLVALIKRNNTRKVGMTHKSFASFVIAYIEMLSIFALIISSCMSESELKQRTTTSLLWSFLDKFGHQLINLISSIILMAVVAKGEFGIMGILAVFIAFSNIIIDSGFSRALLNRKEISDREYTTVFIFNVGLSLFIYIALFFASPYLASLFSEPRLTPVARVLFISFLLNALGLIQQILLIKRADFRGLTKINIPAVILAAIIAIGMAVKGFGIWALVAQLVGYSFFRTLFLWLYTGWRPKLMFSRTLLMNSMGLSSKLLASSLISAVFNNIYPSIIAFFYPNSLNSVADYTQANKYQDIPFAMISNTFRSISMLVLSEINQELDRLKRVVSKLHKTIAFISFLTGLFMILVAYQVFELIWADKWLSAVPYFQMLTLAGIVSPFIFVLGELYIARERASFFLGIEIVKRIILIILIWLFIPKGIMGLATSWVVYTYITLVISLVLSDKLVKYSLLSFLKDALPYALIALLANGVAYFATTSIDSNLLYILVNFFIVSIVYILTCKLFRLEIVKEMEIWIKARIHKSNNRERNIK